MIFQTHEDTHTHTHNVTLDKTTSKKRQQNNNNVFILKIDQHTRERERDGCLSQPPPIPHCCRIVCLGTSHTSTVPRGIRREQDREEENWVQIDWRKLLLVHCKHLLQESLFVFDKTLLPGGRRAGRHQLLPKWTSWRQSKASCVCVCACVSTRCWPTEKWANDDVEFVHFEEFLLCPLGEGTSLPTEPVLTRNCATFGVRRKTLRLSCAFFVCATAGLFAFVTISCLAVTLSRRWTAWAKVGHVLADFLSFPSSLSSFSLSCVYPNLTFSSSSSSSSLSACLIYFFQSTMISTFPGVQKSRSTCFDLITARLLRVEAGREVGVDRSWGTKRVASRWKNIFHSQDRQPLWNWCCNISPPPLPLSLSLPSKQSCCRRFSSFLSNRKSDENKLILIKIIIILIQLLVHSFDD